ncbi:MAG: hypothetical protein ABEI13_02780, partial [Candidatus Paceibacteria bacterium]
VKIGIRWFNSSMRIIPAILTNERKDFQQKLDIASQFTSYVQVDVMDGQFVPNESLLPRAFYYLDFHNISFEAHLMVAASHLEYIIQSLKSFSHCKRIYVHAEALRADEDMRYMLNRIIDQNQEAGIALNPETQWQTISPYLSKVDAVLFMGVNPGFYGSEFQESVLKKVASFQVESEWNGTISWDGGANAQTIPNILEAGATDIAVGSAIMKAEDPQQAFTKLQTISDT